MKKRLLSALMATALCAGMLSGCGSSSDSSSAEGGAEASGDTIKIGIACPLTGTDATYGELMKSGAEIAIKEINDAGGVNGQMLELVAMDDKNDPSEAALVAQRFVDEGDITMVISHGGSSCTLAAEPIYEAGKMANISPSSSNPELTELGYQCYARYGMRDDRLSPQVVAMLGNNLGLKKIGIIYANNDYGRGNLDSATATAAQLGMEVVAQETYNPGLEKDFSTIISKLQQAGCEGMAVYMDHTDAGLYFQQAHALGFDVPSVGQSGLTYSSMVELAGADALQNLYVALTFNPFSTRDIVVNFNKLFDEEYSTTDVPTEPCGNSYDIVHIVAQALEEGATKDNLCQWIKNTTDDNSGTFTVKEALLGDDLQFDENGDLQPRGASLVKVSPEGEFVEYDETIDLTGVDM